MIKFTVRPHLMTNKKTSDGSCPLKICITTGGQRTYVGTPYKILEKHFKDGQVRGVPNAAIINAFITSEISKINKRIFDKTSVSQTVKLDDIRVKKNPILFREYAKVIRYDKTRVARIEAFQEDVKMIDIDLAFLRALEIHERERGSHHNTIHSTFKYLSQLLRAAKKEKIMEENPMDMFKMPKYTKPEKDYLVDRELKALWKLLDKNLQENTRATLVYFLLACYSGLRHSDWGTFDAGTMCEEDDKGQLLLRLRAYKNKQDVVIPVGPTLKKVVDLTYGLPPALSNQKCNVHLKAIGVMAGLEKKITCHTARHTAGNYFASVGLNKSIVAQLLAITESTAEVYFHLSGANIRKQAAVLTTL